MFASPTFAFGAYTVYLKSGGVIQGAESVREQGGMVEVVKHGIVLKVPGRSVERIIEGGDADKSIPGPVRGLSSPEEPVTAKDNEVTPQSVPELKNDSDNWLALLRNEYHQVVSVLREIDILEKRSTKLGALMHRKIRAGLVRKGRRYRKEKAAVDGRLAELKEQESALRKRKEELERVHGIESYDEPVKPGHDDGTSLPEGQLYYRLPDTGIVSTPAQGLRTNPQLRELRIREKSGTLPGQFKPYKDFQERQGELQR